MSKTRSPFGAQGRPEADRKVVLGTAGDFDYVVGSARECDVRIDHGSVSDEHLLLLRRGDRLFISDLGSDRGTYLNGSSIPRLKRVEITRHDFVHLGGGEVRLEMSPRLFLGRDRVGLDSTLLGYRTAGGRTLCHEAFVRARPGTITAIMGPSGAGKTVLLNLLGGYYRPTEGEVYVGQSGVPRPTGSSQTRFLLPVGEPQGEATTATEESVSGIDLHKHFASVRDFIGYVPQAEVMIPELTVAASLHYRLCLRYPDISSTVAERLVQETCESLGFEGERLERFLHTRIGSPESRGRVLSGGERRRANIAHELIIRPLILLLDEPTSGLSSYDADRLILLLHRLAKRDGVTILMTVHQPSQQSFERFDDLLLLNHGGTIAYYGRARHAVRYLEDVTGSAETKEPSAERVVSLLQSYSTKPDELANAFAKHRGGSDPLIRTPLSEARQEDEKALESRRRRSRTTRKPLHKVVTLFKRSLHVFVADRGNLAWTFLQVPLIALLLVLGFQGIPAEQAESDRFARVSYHLDRLSEPYLRNQFPIPTSRVLEKATVLANLPAESGKIGEAHARQRATVYFMLVLAAVWFGVIASVKEIVTEQHMILRESRSCIGLGGLLISKIAFLCLVVACQSILLLCFTLPFLLNLSLGQAVQVAGVLALSGCAGSLMGLLLSALARTYRAALTVVPLLMIPQIVFGGLLRQMEGMAEWVSNLMVQRWAFDAVLRLDPMKDGQVLVQIHPEGEAVAATVDLNVVGTQLHGLFFGWGGEPTGFSRWGAYPYLVILVLILTLAIATSVALRFKMSRLLR